MGKERTFVEWFFEIAIPEHKNRIYLQGDGGFGKTKSLLFLHKQLINNYEKFGILPIYIVCNKLMSSDTVEKLIVRKYCGNDACFNVGKIYDVLKDDRYRYLIIFDGLNEVNESIVNKIVYDFLDYVIGNNKEYNNIFVIISTRDEKLPQEETIVNILKYEKIILKPLDKIRVENIVKVDIKNPTNELIHVMTNPMALSLYMKTDKRFIYKDSKTLTDILDKYFCNEIETVSLWRKYTNDQKVLFEFTINVFLPMLLEFEKFIYSKSDIKEMLNLVRNYIDNNFEFEFKKYIELNNYDLVILKYNNNFNYMNVFNYLVNDLKIVNQEGLNLKIHQVYIDYFCATRFDKLIDKWIQSPQNFPLWCFGRYISIGSHKVISLSQHSKLSIRERSYENLIEVLNVCRNNRCEYEQDILALTTSILSSKNNSLTGIDFSSLDLRKCNFNNICLGKNNGDYPAIFKNVRVSINNFVNDIWATCVSSDDNIRIISYSDERLIICDYTINYIYIINVIYNSVVKLRNCITYSDSVIDDEIVLLNSKDGKKFLYVYKISSHKFEKITEISRNFAEKLECLSVINIQNQNKYVFTYIDNNSIEKSVVFNKDGSILASGKLMKKVNIKIENGLIFSRIKEKNKYLILKQNNEEKQLCLLGNSEYGINQFAYTNKKIVALCQNHKSFLIREYDYNGSLINEIIPSTSILKKSWYLKDKSMIIYYNYDGRIITFRPDSNKKAYSYYNSYTGKGGNYLDLTFCNCIDGIYMIVTKNNGIQVCKYDEKDAYFKPYSNISFFDIEMQCQKTEKSQIKILSVNKILSNVDTNEKLNRPGFIGYFNCIDENNNEIVICQPFRFHDNSWFNHNNADEIRYKIYKIGLTYFDPIIFGKDCTRLRLTEHKDCLSTFEKLQNKVNEKVMRDIKNGNFDVFLFMSGCDDRRYKVYSDEIKKEPEEIFLYSCYSAHCSVIVFTSPQFRRYENIVLNTLVVYDYNGISATINNDASKEDEKILKELFYLNKVRRYPYRYWTAKLHGCIISSIDLNENDKKSLQEFGYSIIE